MRVTKTWEIEVHGGYRVDDLVSDLAVVDCRARVSVISSVSGVPPNRIILVLEEGTD